MKKLLIIMVSAFCLTFAVNTTASAEEMAVGGGAGIALPVGDMDNVVDFGIPLFVNFQYAVQPQITVEADIYYWIMASEAEDWVDSFSLLQYGVSGRYWLDSAFDGVYFGAGFAFTKWKLKQEWVDPFFGDTETISVSDTESTLVLKGGFAMPLGEGLYLDFGGRLDMIDFDGDFTMLSGYAMAVKTF